MKSFDHFCIYDYLLLCPLQWRHDECDGVSNQQRFDCLLNRLFRRRSKKTWKLCVTGLCEGNSPGTGEFPVQSASNAENVSIWWRRHAIRIICNAPQVTRRTRRSLLFIVWFVSFGYIHKPPCYLHIEAEKKWQTLAMHIFVWQLLYCD